MRRAVICLLLAAAPALAADLEAELVFTAGVDPETLLAPVRGKAGLP